MQTERDEQHKHHDAQKSSPFSVEALQQQTHYANDFCFSLKSFNKCFHIFLRSAHVTIQSTYVPSYQIPRPESTNLHFNEIYALPWLAETLITHSIAFQAN